MEHVWLRHPATGGYWRCPAGAVGIWTEMGWQPAGPPPEPPDRVVAERIARRVSRTTATEKEMTIDG